MRFQFIGWKSTRSVQLALLGFAAIGVGYGATNASGAGAGVKRQVAVKVNRFDDGIVDIGDRDVGACHGDSGGPLYMQAGDATHDWGWRTVGSTSSAGSSFCDCTCNTIYVNIAMHVAAIERDEGIDVTPCTDENGDWDPSPECAGFASAGGSRICAPTRCCSSRSSTSSSPTST